MKSKIKALLKNNRRLYNIVSWIIKNYLSFVYYTIRWSYQILEDYHDSRDAKVFIMWHDELAIAPYAFRNHKNLNILVSPHSDGAIISKTLMRFRHNIIEGSSNKQSFEAARKIVKILKHGGDIAITPDGPRGPRHKSHTNIIGLAKITKSKIIPVSCLVDKYIQLKSWDLLMVPLPFAKGTIKIGKSIDPKYIVSEDGNIEIEKALHFLRNKA